MVSAVKRRIVLSAICTTLVSMASSLHAEPSARELDLLQALDRAFKPGLLDTDGKRRLPDGSYARMVSTGDAVTKSTIASPLIAVRTACATSGNTFELAISAGRADATQKTRTITLAGETVTIDRARLWGWFSSFDELASLAENRGFAPLFSTSPFVERAARSAEADPPFGLFICHAPTGETLWAAAIMPSGRPIAYDLPIRVIPITHDWIRGHNDAIARGQARLEADRRAQAAEEARLKPFREGLEIGSRTNCGIVIGVRGPLVQVQLPPEVRGPDGAREFWVARGELTDGPPPTGCRFGG
ncbi:MAG: hypothetical protein J7498_01795 [Sphingobium sp.]|nr:hypothetical protein [Sphingobium sp.]